MPHSRALGKDCANQWEEGTWSTDAASTPQFQWNFIQARVKNLIKQKKNCKYVRLQKWHCEGLTVQKESGQNLKAC